MTLRLRGDNCMPMLMLILEILAEVPEEQLGIYGFVESELRGKETHSCSNKNTA